GLSHSPGLLPAATQLNHVHLLGAHHAGEALRITGQHDDLMLLSQLGQHHVHVPTALRVAVTEAVVDDDRHSPAPGHQRCHRETGKQIDLLPRTTREGGHVESHAVV